MVDSYSKLSIGKYRELVEILDKDIEEIDKQVEIIACLNDIDTEVVYNLPLNKYEEYSSKLGFLFEAPKPSSNVPSNLVINGKQYTVLKNVEKMSTGQYIDLQTYLKEDLSPEYILSTIIIPKGLKYSDYDPVDVINELRDNLDIQNALSIAFFLHRRLEYTIKGSLHFLDWMMKKWQRKNPKTKENLMEARQRLKDLQRSGIGFI